MTSRDKTFTRDTAQVSEVSAADDTALKWRGASGAVGLTLPVGSASGSASGSAIMSDQRQAAKAAELNNPPNERLAADTWAVVHGGFRVPRESRVHHVKCHTL